MAAESKEVNVKVDQETLQETLGLSTDGAPNGVQKDGGDGESKGGEGLAAAEGSEKKKKSKKDKLKKPGSGKNENEGPLSTETAGQKLTPGMIDQLLEMNASLKGELSGLDKGKQVEAIKKLDVADLMSGMVWMIL